MSDAVRISQSNLTEPFYQCIRVVKPAPENTVKYDRLKICLIPSHGPPSWSAITCVGRKSGCKVCNLDSRAELSFWS